jgi:sterol desaturase/sphingolipid hydroxylase (fatty acid hydroxylase superfamily)
MLDNHQFSLIIISVGLAAYLGSLAGWHHDQIDLLTEKLTTLNGHTVENKQQDAEVSKKEPVAQVEEVTQQLRDLNKRLVQVMLASWLLVLFVGLLAARVLCWAWVNPAYLAEKRVAGCFLSLDRAVVTTLTILLLYLTGFHVVHNVSSLIGH